MTRFLVFSALLTALACSPNDGDTGLDDGQTALTDAAAGEGGDAATDADDAGDPDTGEPDTGEPDAGESDAGADATTDIAADTAPPAPSWVNPTVPEGPIPPPPGTDVTAEDADFNWAGVGAKRVGDTLPLKKLDWSAYPKYGTAKVLDWSNSKECVCFDVDCATCSASDCGANTCTYDLNDKHTLTKYHVELRSTEYSAHALTFEVNISAKPAISYTDIKGVLARLERIPVQYWYGLRIITEFGRGIQFLHASYFGGGGAAAYGSMNYIDTRTVNMNTLLHELGHSFEQYTRKGNPPTLKGQANILNPIWRNAIRSDDVRTSMYGNSNEWEDMAEFSRIYAQCLVEGSLDKLDALSPERFRIWERIILNGTTIKP